LSTNTEALSQAAIEYGIEPEYIDIWGRPHPTPEDTARAILHSLGVADLERSLEQRKFDEWTRPLDPTLVVRDLAPGGNHENEPALRLRIPAARAGASVKLEICWEGGDLEHHWFWLPELRTLEDAVIRGTGFVAKHLPLPRRMRIGYHEIRAYWVKDPELELFCQSRFIVCPARAWNIDQRIAGVALTLYGLRSARNWGCGDFSDLYKVIDAFAPAGVAFIALNPLHAIPNRQPYNTSPYLPQCTLYRNFLYLDVEKVADAEKVAPPVPDPTEIQTLRGSEFVEYERVARLKLAALHTIFDALHDSSPEFDRYCEAEGSLLEDFAVYCALDQEMHHQNPDVWLWTDWPEPYRDPRSQAVADFAREHRKSVQFYKFLQWHIDRQLAEVQAYALEKGMRIGLYHDLALATDRFGADLWAHRPFYVAGCRVGAPRDDFSPHGQDWGFPPPNRETHRANGYELFAQSIRKNARHGGALRIDHVMRFFHLYWIPDEKAASDGAYVRDFAQDLLGILALESQRAKFIVIGEDLGTVTGEIRQALSESGLLSYRLFWFEKHPDGTFRKPGEYPAQAAASTTTHDLPTLAGFAAARDIEARKAAGLIDENGYREQLAHRQVELRLLRQSLQEAGFPDDPVGFLLSTPATVAIVNQEDLTGETEQQNLPGSTWQHPNWRRKMKVAVEDLGPLAESLKSKITRSGRA
jgi:4-alpha-glucanotransferase